MMISTKGRYALRVLINMAERQTTGYVPLKEIAAQQDISEKYLESIVKELVKGHVLEGNSTPCARAAECRTLPLWKGLNDLVNDYLDQYTIEDLMKKDYDGFDYVI